MKRTMLFGLAAAVALAFLGGVVLADVKAPGPLGLPSVETLKTKLTLTEDQAQKVEQVYSEYKDKAKEAEKQGDEAKKTLRTEIVAKLKEGMSDDQKKKLDELVSDKKKEDKKNGN